MKIAEKKVNILRQNLILTNKRALYWVEQNSLIISDLHLGKTAHFRKNGLALPTQLILNDLARLSELIQHFRVKKLMIIGDFIHAGYNSEFDLFTKWKEDYSSLEIILIKGNHDRVSDIYFSELGIKSIHSELEIYPFLFSHEFIETEKYFVISGHIHPGVNLVSKVKNNHKFRCFIKTNNQLILPAFSSFAGTNTKDHPLHATYFIFTDDDIFEIS